MPKPIPTILAEEGNIMTILQDLLALQKTQELWALLSYGLPEGLRE